MFNFLKRKKKEPDRLEGTMKGAEFTPRQVKDETPVQPVITRKKLRRRIQLIELTLVRLRANDAPPAKIKHWEDRLERVKSMEYFYYGR